MSKLEIILAILGLLIAWLTYKKTFFSEPIEEKEHLLVQFRATQTLSIQVRQLLEEFTIINNCQHEQMFPGISYQTYISKMESSYQENLSDALYDRILNGKLPKHILLSMGRSLEKQYEDLSKMKIQFELLLKR